MSMSLSFSSLSLVVNITSAMTLAFRNANLNILIGMPMHK